jgi:3-deoxy-D-manno-oct-2-ulosonic acid (Kdo) hydroxylase
MSDDIVVSLPISNWDGPFDPDLGCTAVTALEAGQVVCLNGLAFMTRPEETVLLSSALLDNSRKNISFDPVSGRVGGSAEHPELLAAMLARFARSAELMLRGLLVPYADTLWAGRTSFRPAEIAGRAYSPRHDDRRLHVDAFPSRPIGGARILRLFTVLPQASAAREWRIGEPFEGVAVRFLPALPSPAPLRARLYALLGLTKGVRSAYDQMMLALHDRMKLDADYQRQVSFTPWTFSPGSTWLCFTDQVSHAALSGHMMLEQTFHVPVRSMLDPERSPLRILERLAGRALA